MLQAPSRTASFNAAGQQTQTVVTTGSTSRVSKYLYAGTDQNEIVKQSGSESGRSYSYYYGRTDKNGLPIIEGLTAGTSRAYVFHDNDGVPVMFQTAAKVTCLYMLDGTNNPVAISTNFHTTAEALQYDPYGAETRTDNNGENGATSGSPYSYGLGVQDWSTIETKFGQRWYNPGYGAWTQQDVLNAPLDPKNANRYAYASGDPVNTHDPKGQCGFDSFSDFGDCLQKPLAVVTGCITGAASASANFGVVGFAVAGPAGETAVAAGGCIAGGVAGYYGVPTG